MSVHSYLILIGLKNNAKKYDGHYFDHTDADFVNNTVDVINQYNNTGDLIYCAYNVSVKGDIKGITAAVTDDKSSYHLTINVIIDKTIQTLITMQQKKLTSKNSIDADLLNNLAFVKHLSNGILKVNIGTAVQYTASYSDVLSWLKTNFTPFENLKLTSTSNSPIIIYTKVGYYNKFNELFNKSVIDLETVKKETDSIDYTELEIDNYGVDNLLWLHIVDAVQNTQPGHVYEKISWSEFLNTNLMDIAAFIYTILEKNYMNVLLKLSGIFSKNITSTVHKQIIDIIIPKNIGLNQYEYDTSGYSRTLQCDYELHGDTSIGTTKDKPLNFVDVFSILNVNSWDSFSYNIIDFIKTDASTNSIGVPAIFNDISSCYKDTAITVIIKNNVSTPRLIVSPFIAPHPPPPSIDKYEVSAAINDKNIGIGYLTFLKGSSFKAFISFTNYGAVLETYIYDTDKQYKLCNFKQSKIELISDPSKDCGYYYECITHDLTNPEDYINFINYCSNFMDNLSLFESQLITDANMYTKIDEFKDLPLNISKINYECYRTVTLKETLSDFASQHMLITILTNILDMVITVPDSGYDTFSSSENIIYAITAYLYKVFKADIVSKISDPYEMDVTERDYFNEREKLQKAIVQLTKEHRDLLPGTVQSVKDDINKKIKDKKSELKAMDKTIPTNYIERIKKIFMQLVAPIKERLTKIPTISTANYTDIKYDELLKSEPPNDELIKSSNTYKLLQQLFNSANADILTLKSRISQLSTYIGNNDITIRDNKIKIDELSTKITELEADKINLESEKRNISDGWTAHGAKIEKERDLALSTLKIKESEISSAQAEISKLQGEISTLDLANQTLTADFTALQSKYDALTGTGAGASTTPPVAPAALPGASTISATPTAAAAIVATSIEQELENLKASNNYTKLLLRNYGLDVYDKVVNDLLDKYRTSIKTNYETIGEFHKELDKFLTEYSYQSRYLTQIRYIYDEELGQSIPRPNINIPYSDRMEPINFPYPTKAAAPGTYFERDGPTFNTVKDAYDKKIAAATPS